MLFIERDLMNDGKYLRGLMSGAALSSVIAIGTVAAIRIGEAVFAPQPCAADVAAQFEGASNGDESTTPIKSEITLADGQVCTMTFDVK